MTYTSRTAEPASPLLPGKVLLTTVKQPRVETAWYPHLTLNAISKAKPLPKLQQLALENPRYRAPARTLWRRIRPHPQQNGKNTPTWQHFIAAWRLGSLTETDERPAARDATRRPRCNLDATSSTHNPVSTGPDAPHGKHRRQSRCTFAAILASKTLPQEKKLPPIPHQPQRLRPCLTPPHQLPPALPCTPRRESGPHASLTKPLPAHSAEPAARIPLHKLNWQTPFLVCISRQRTSKARPRTSVFDRKPLPPLIMMKDVVHIGTCTSNNLITSCPSNSKPALPGVLHDLRDAV